MMREPGMWSKQLWEVREACLYWNGFPIHWTWDEIEREYEVLLKPDNIATASEEEIIKKDARFSRVYNMYNEILHKIIKKLIHVYFHNGCYFLTPHEFVRFAKSKKMHPYEVAIFDELEKANRPDSLTIYEAWQKRSSPRLASTSSIAINAKSKRRSEWSEKKTHREQVKACAREINLEIQMHSGTQKTDVTKIYKHPKFQICLKKLRSFRDHSEIVTYKPSLITKNWIPQAIGRGSVGRPRKRKKAKSNKNQQRLPVY